MSSWEFKEATESCAKIFNRAAEGEPQVVFLEDRPAVVVISYSDYQLGMGNIEKKKSSFVDALLSCPKLEGGEELDIARDPSDCGRSVDL